MLSRGATILCLLANLTLAIAAFVIPEPVSVCSQGAGPGQTACPSLSGSCCSGGECCAGGCCPLTAVCINKGRDDEGCCPIDDATTCGKVLPTLSVCSGSPGPSMTCTAGDSSTWVCPPDKACGVRFNACLAAPNVCTTTGGSAPPTATGGSSSAGAGGGPTATTSGSPSGSRAVPAVELGGLVWAFGAWVVGVALNVVV